MSKSLKFSRFSVFEHKRRMSMLQRDKNTNNKYLKRNNLQFHLKLISILSLNLQYMYYFFMSYNHYNYLLPETLL